AIVHLYEFTIQDGIAYLIMEYVQGESLNDLLKRHGPISIEQTVQILSPIFDALSYLHQNKIIHRDLKPSNIIVLPDGSGKLIDFGIAKALDEDMKLTQTGTQIGTALYMAPEQIRGEPVSPQTDLYAMGLVVYECLFGRFPWEWQGLTPFQLYQRLLTEPPPIPENTPTPWRTFFQYALAKEAGNRYPSAEEMKNALSQLARPSSQPTPSKVKSTPPPLPTPPPPASAEAALAHPKSRKGSYAWLWVLVIWLVVVIGLAKVCDEYLRPYLHVEVFELETASRFSNQSEASPAPLPPLEGSLSQGNNSQQDLSDKLRSQLWNYLNSHAAEEQNMHLVWGFPDIPKPFYEKSGSFKVPVTMHYTYSIEEAQEVEEVCPSGDLTRAVITYRTTYECEQKDYARVRFEYDQSSESFDFKVSLPEKDHNNCFIKSREEINRIPGQCE
ncbi:MAG: serine/threonine protein kinase, partial [Bacteroidia bacterium]|nr:serine/threonine protein kinase [Bacteroidia bacterium]MDW8058403.1 serine/threonine-protein kinase [Bacteroidia bacterium]